MLKRALGVVVCLFLWTPGYAQTLGTITGEVKDASGAVIPGATVTAQNIGNQRDPYPATATKPAPTPFRRCRPAPTWSRPSCRASRPAQNRWNCTWSKRSA